MHDTAADEGNCWRGESTEPRCKVKGETPDLRMTMTPAMLALCSVLGPTTKASRVFIPDNCSIHHAP